MAEPIIRTYVAVTVDPDPRIFLLGEDDIPRKNLDSSPILYSWLRAGAAGVIGVKFSSWMIKQGKLTSSQRSVVSDWNRAESDFEVFFGPERKYETDPARGDEPGAAHMLRLDAQSLAICFPIQGSSLGKGDAEALAASLGGGTKPQ